MQVTKESERVERSVALFILAYLLLVRLYGQDEACTQGMEPLQAQKTLYRGGGTGCRVAY